MYRNPKTNLECVRRQTVSIYANAPFAINRRRVITFAALLVTSACSVQLLSTNPFAQSSLFVKPEVVWNSEDYNSFLNSLHPVGILALKQALGLLKPDDTEAKLLGTPEDLTQIREAVCRKSSWFGRCADPRATNYHDLVIEIAKRADVDTKLLSGASTYAAEELLMEKVRLSVERDFVTRWNKMPASERELLLDKVDPNKRLKDRAALVAGAGSAVIAAVATTTALTGFGAYIAATTMLAAAASAIAITLPIGVYTSLTAWISVISGPVGWGAALVGLMVAALRWQRPALEELAPFVMTMHAIKLDALQAI